MPASPLIPRPSPTSGQNRSIRASSSKSLRQRPDDRHTYRYRDRSRGPALLVIESHTHFRPDDYVGPPADRIRALVDSDGDGRADRITNFYEGGVATMNLAVYEDGSVFVATRMEVSRLFDRDGDGHADDRQPIAHLETKGDYPHNGLSGFAFDALGSVYFGLGENLARTTGWSAPTARRLAGGGEGGSIYRCRADGTKLTASRPASGIRSISVSTRLIVFSPSTMIPIPARPCRLIHIVSGGDYGYRYRNGRKGVHPVYRLEWRIAGTLPMAAGTGEAPSGVLAYESDMLPAEYRGTSWRRPGATIASIAFGSLRVVRCLAPRRSPLIIGGENFRPVGIALAADGSLFVSDWVDKSYSVHGKGASGASASATQSSFGHWTPDILDTARAGRRRSADRSTTQCPTTVAVLARSSGSPLSRRS